MTPRRTAAWVAGVALLLVGRAARAGDERLVMDARDGLRDVFARPEFGPLLEKDRIDLPDLPDLHMPDLTWPERLVKWLADVFESVFTAIGKALGWLAQAIGNIVRAFQGISGPEGAIIPAYLVWVVTGLAIAILIWILLRHRTGRRMPGGSALVGVDIEAGGVDDALAKSPEAWRREAAQFAQGGQRRDALRALYLALLAQLHGMGAIDYDRTRTNTAYLGDLSSRHQAYEPFRRLTLRFDRVWYGGMDIEAPDLKRSEHDADAVRNAYAEASRVA